jgi:hypothetical protein
MAKRLKVTSATKPSEESQPAERWWKIPAVMAAIITGVAAIIVAIIGLGAPKSKPSEPVNIEQQTHGPNSPAVAHTGRNVIIVQPPSDKQP